MLMLKRVHPMAVLAIGLVLGLLLGMLLFWVLFPVKWTNAHSYDLAPTAKAEYVALVADAYKLDRDHTRSAQLLSQWTPQEKQLAFNDAITIWDAQGRADKVQEVQDLALVLGVSLEPVQQPPAPATQPQGLLERLRVPCMVFLIVLLAFVLGWIGLRVLSRQRAQSQSETEPTTKATPPAAQWQAATTGSSLGHWLTTYKLGEDTYDESFPIETASGEYLGECGVGISELSEVGEADHVTAFEIWLFDKSDIKTVTKILMSDLVFQDEALRAKLASKGEPVLAEVNKPFTLETTGLVVQAKVTELEYGQKDPAVNSFFSRLALDLAANVRSAQASST